MLTFQRKHSIERNGASRNPRGRSSSRRSFLIRSRSGNENPARDSGNAPGKRPTAVNGSRAGLLFSLKTVPLQLIKGLPVRARSAMRTAPREPVLVCSRSIRSAPSLPPSLPLSLSLSLSLSLASAFTRTACPDLQGLFGDVRQR